MTLAGFEQHPWLMADFSVRQGGMSSAYGPDELNLGYTREDDAECVTKNRLLFLDSVAGRPSPTLVTVRQIHGNVTHLTTRNDKSFPTADGLPALEGDGLMTRETGLLVGIQTADCTPVLVADTRTRAVAAFHAGWRGTVARVVELGVAQMTAAFGSRPGDLIAAVGPAIRTCCFEVGGEVIDNFAHEFVYAEELFAGRKLDLQEANRRQLLGAGVSEDRISIVAECTACAFTAQGDRKYFSYRADHGRTGRMLNVIGVRSR